jgi:LEA14-like dessication related protein
VDKLGIGTTVMSFDVQYFNPNKSRAKLKEAEGEAWLDSNYVGHFHVDTMVNIPAKSDFTVPVKLDVDMKFFLKYSLTGFRNEEVLVTVNGTAKVGKAGIYKRIPLHYEHKQNLAQLIK